MYVELLWNSPLSMAAFAVRTCWDSRAKADNGGVLDKELLKRVGNENKHGSVLEHLVYSFNIEGISRACLMELTRHRIASYSVKSTRYTLKKELKDADLSKRATTEQFLIDTRNEGVNKANIKALKEVQKMVKNKIGGDILKYAIPEALKTTLVMTINARSLQNMFSLRTSHAALWEIRELGKELFNAIPTSHKYLFEEFITQ